MLKKPTFNKGYWIYTENGFEIYDGMDRLVKIETDVNKFNQIIEIIDNEEEFNSYDVNELRIGIKGVNAYFETKETQQEKQEILSQYNSKCVKCENLLPKKYYNINGQYLCGRCYKKEDTLMNRLTLKGV